MLNLMHDLIKKVPVSTGYMIGDHNISIVCYADVAENEDDLQRLLQRFNITAKLFNMVISA